ncbi:MAG: hypothetical protein IT378_25800 [Sandaracinaceae bacterium]|nr:hypothetical protein [Sandaracinaceae bacterium]
MSRLKRFRELMRTLDPSGDPKLAIERDWYIERPEGMGVAQQVASRLELEPWSRHLIVGGIGSGKTTELLRINAALGEARQAGDVASYVDVAAQTRLDRVGCGTLVALAGTQLGAKAQRRARLAKEELPATVTKVAQWFAEFAHGYEVESQPPSDEEWEALDVDDGGEYEPPLMERVPGVLSPEPPIDETLRPAVAKLKVLRAAATPHDGHCAFLFDSLDRTKDPDAFITAIKDDVRVLQRAEIGVVVVGPLRFRYGEDRRIVDLFDDVHFLPEIPPTDKTGRTFLTDILAKRAPDDILPRGPRVAIARGSGGVLRDLVAIAKGAAREAYGAGADAISLEHVEQAIDQHGRVLAVGLDGEQVKALRKVRDKGTLVVRGPREITLLETRRVLDYGRGRFVVHPALAPLLDAMTEAA